MSFSFSPKIVTDGLILYLDAANTKSYTSGSTSWVDLSRENNNAILTNGPTFSTANAGSIVFDGTNDFITGSSSDYAFGTGEFTVNYWTYINSFSGTGTPTIVDLRNGPPDSDGYADFIQSSTNTFRLYWNNSTRYISTGSISTGQWYNIAVTRQTNTIYVYINGQLDGSTTNSTNFTGTSLKLARNINTVSTSYLNGNIAQVLIYNKFLSSTQILQNYNTTKTRFGL